MAWIPFEKMQGSGNDFVLIDHRAPLVGEAEKPAFVRAISARRTAVGSDGVIFLEPDEEFDFRWHFFNADGSEAEMCGNGARCAAVFARKCGAAGETMAFRTLAGRIEATVVAGGARVSLTEARRPEPVEGLRLEGREVEAWFVNTGVPHLVLPVEDLPNVPVEGWGRPLRNDPHFAPAGTNVNFLASGAGAGEVAIRTYERGVEGETLACGTGAVASALVTAARDGKSPPVEVRVRSGEVLRIGFIEEGASVRGVTLEGPVVEVFEGRLAWPGPLGEAGAASGSA